MKEEFLKQLHCPYCGSAFELVKKLDIYGEDIISGIAKCDCRGYPIVSGILALNTLNLNALNQALGELKRGDSKLALLQLLGPVSNISRVIQAAKNRGVPFSEGIDKLRTKSIQSYLNKFQRIDSFSMAVDYCNSISFGGYFKHRFSSSTFLSAIPLIVLMQHLPGPVLEIGCGMGHHGFVISQLYSGRESVLTDSSFINLYLAKKFFAPRAEYICLNANDPLPFADQSFCVVFASDSLHYLHSKKLAAGEISRVCHADNGAVFLSHLHNIERENQAAGEPLAASGWLNLLSFGRARLYSEAQVLKDFLNEDKLDLLRDYSHAGSKEENAFALVATSDPKLFRVYEHIGESFFNLRSHLIVNPLYQALFKGSQVLLRKTWPAKYIRVENMDIDAFLLDTFALDRQFMEKISQGLTLELDASIVTRLLKKFVLINAPAHY